MEKENINRVYINSQAPEPTLPVNLFKPKSNCDTEQRHPLKTINNQQINCSELAGPSKPVKKVKNVSRQHFDTRYVTIRQKEELDSDLKVFKDDSEKDKTVITISDDEDKEQNEEIRNAVTPNLHSLEFNRIRNIKKSLKRPHSRELQRISSFAKRVNECEKYENLSTKSLSRDYVSDVITYLLSIEEKSTIARIPSVTRACVINWLIKVNGANGVLSIVQTACWYLDAILARECVQLDKLQVISAACYWISQKWHGPSVLASRLVKCSNKAFSGETLMAAEKYVICKLNFPRQPVVPNDFITYLSSWCDEAQPGSIEAPATFLCMAGMMVNRKISDEYPSVVAVAAVWNALFLMKRKDLLKRLKLCPVYEIIKKKAVNIQSVASVQRRAVRWMVDPSYEYKALLENFGGRPHYVAEIIVEALNELARKQPEIN